MIEQAKNILVNAVRGTRLVDGCVIMHPDNSTPLYVTPWYPSFQGKLPNGSTVTFEYVPMRVDLPQQMENLSQQYKIIVQDLNTFAADWLDEIPIESDTPVDFSVCSYIIDGYDESVKEIADGPYETEIREFTSEAKGIGFIAEAQATNQTKCGERGTIGRTGGLYRQFT